MNATTEFWRDAAMPYVESRRACDSRACYRTHSHPTFSIGAVDQGTSLFTGAACGAVTLHRGAVVFVPASRVHACNPLPDTAWSYQMLHLDAAWRQAVRQEYIALASAAEDGEPVRVLVDPIVHARFCRLNALLFSTADCRDKEAALIEFIGQCDETQGLHIPRPGPTRRTAVQIAPVLEFLSTQPGTDTSLVDLAQRAGMSRYQLIRAFRAATGMTPHAWKLNERVNLARERIRAGASIIGVAHELGFADQAHFQRVFKAHVGVTPGSFRS
ncbi:MULTISPECIES: helix-turn-helix domain-containing protein [Stenotrophomonas]|uniref:helix-turn-helix domain-containing protein n=1 Tax=Stenotrophomonas TaxID=40323 RepID=UPI0019A575D2|nr:AraC family transcriptional regulator [Stenotrophomonas sp. PS02300]MBD3773881.1 helix-turn-helix transcriptional regulator [Paracoccaceae bacterium]